MAMLPLVVLPLVRMQIITEKHLNDQRSLLDVFLKHFRKGTKKVEWCVAIDESFLKESIRLWRRGERFIAVVLYATAVEQYMNSLYQHILPAQGWTSNQIDGLCSKHAIRSWRRAEIALETVGLIWLVL